jgi:hypothetical protein
MKNNIYSDPKGWAAKAVGSALRYRLMQSVTLILGFVLAFIFYLLCNEARLPLLAYVGMLLGLLIAVVELPLFYLRALRFYVVERQQRGNEVS